MSDLISREALIEKIEKRIPQMIPNILGMHDVTAEGMVKFIKIQPPVEAVPVVHGEWERVGSGSLYDVYECTNCHCPPKWDCLGDNHWKIAFTDFCPQCGADMRKKV